MRTAVDWTEIRKEFPALDRWTYLNTATFGQIPRRSVEAAVWHFARRDETASADFLSWFDDIDKLRGSLAKLIGAEAGDIAFVTNAASALSLLITGLTWNPGDRIVTLRDEFPNNLYSPALLARRGIDMVEATWEGFYDALTPRTRLVVLSEVNYTNGFRPPAAEISRRVHELGGLLYLDGTQSLGALQFSVKDVQPDLYAAHGYKWLLSPNGAAFMYVRPSLRAQLEPLVIGWRSHKAWREVDNLHHGAPEFVEAAEKYEGGMLPFAVLYPMQSSVEMILEIGPDTIEHRVLELADYTREELRRIGAQLPGDGRPHFTSPIIAARFPGRPPSALAYELKAKKVLISARHDNLRISTHFYNTEEDIDLLISTLKKVL